MKFSIIIPTYNRASLIHKAIESVVAQTYDNWELLIIDDGSTDNTKEIVSAYLNDKVKYIFQENSERGAARNNGIRHANGDYVFFLDSDDFIEKNYLDHAKKLIEGNPNSKLFHIPYLLIYPNRLAAGPNLKNIQKSIFNSNKFACQVIVEKQAAQQYPFSEDRKFKVGEDWWFILQIISHNKFAVGKEALGRIVQHDTRSMDSPDIESLTYSKEKLLSLVENDKVHTKNEELKKSIHFEFDYLLILSKFDRKIKKKSVLSFILKNPKVIFSKRFLVLIKKSILG